MSPDLPDDVPLDPLAVSLAKMIAAANLRAREFGIEASQSLITIAQRLSADKTLWRINYGVKDFVGRRGGDLVIDMNDADCSVDMVSRGQ